MKLSKLYCNRPNIFPDINFEEGVNVIYAKVAKPKDRETDSHNLGKTLFGEVIDFCMLKKTSFLKKHSDLFGEFIFYLEVAINSGGYLTIVRPTSGRGVIHIKSHANKGHDFRQAEGLETGLSLEDAQKQLNDKLGLRDSGKWSYRQGIGYVLRRQEDYRQVFQISKFSKGKDKDWKPYMSHILGFNAGLVEGRYLAEKRWESANQFKERLAEDTGTDTNAIDKVKGLLEIRLQEQEELREIVESFDFAERDISYIRHLVTDIEDRLVELNDLLYASEHELKKISESLTIDIEFSPEEIHDVYEQVGIVFDGQVKKSYEDLLDFHKALFTERSARLKSRRLKLQDETTVHQSELKVLNSQRENILGQLRQRDSFEKYRSSHTRAVLKEKEVSDLQAELIQLDRISALEADLKRLRDKKMVPRCFIWKAWFLVVA